MSSLFINRNGDTWESTLLFKLLFIVSGTAMTGLCAVTGIVSVFMIMGVVCSFVIICFLVLKRNFIEKVFTRPKKSLTLLCVVFAAFASWQYSEYLFYRFADKTEKVMRIINRFINIDETTIFFLFTAAVMITGICAIPAVASVLYVVYKKLSTIVKDILCRQSDSVDKYFLIILGVVISIGVTAIFSQTGVFYSTYVDNNNQIINYDIIYTTDSPNEVLTNVYFIINYFNF